MRPRVIALGVPHPTQDELYDYGLFLLQRILQQSGHHLAQHQMPTPQNDWERRGENHLIAEQLQYQPQDQLVLAEEHLHRLNDEQRVAYDHIMDSIENQRGKLFFLSGPGGTGKTYVYNTVCARAHGNGRIVLCVASSGIAALLLPGGRTAHSMFKIPVEGLNHESVCSINKESQLADLIRLADAVVWDEITLQHKHVFEATDRTFRDICNDDRPFGGRTVIFGGDFQQILPVVVRGSREDIVGACLQRSTLWEHIEILRLTQNMRLRNDPSSADFAQWLLDVGHGRNSDDDGKVKLPASMKIANIDALMDFIYPDIETTPPPPPEYFAKRSILSARNTDVDEINAQILARMSGVERVYVSADSVLDTNGTEDPDTDIPPEFLRSIQSSELPPGELHVKPGCPLILLRNLTPARGLCNGTRMVLIRSSDRVLEVKILGGMHDGSIAFIPRIAITPSNTQGHFSFTMRRRQFPVRLAFAMTINKAQGQSVDWVGIDLRIPVFSHGQLYVALSRVTASNRVKVVLPDIEDGSKALNIVYPEVILD